MTLHLHPDITEDLYQNAPCGYMSICIDGRIIHVNNTLLDWLKLDRDSVVNKLSFQDLLGMGDKIFLENHFIPLLKLQGSVSEIQLVLRGNGDIRVPVMLNAREMNNQAEDSPLYRISLLDDTHRRQFEQELISEQQKAKERNQRLKEINDELEHFAHIASHDLQAPLNSILGIVDLLKQKNLFESGSEEEELFSMITTSTEQMRNMIRDLLAYSKIEVSKDDMVEVPLNEACREALTVLNDEIQKNQARFHIPDLPVVKGVRSLIVRLLQNLFSNAIKYRTEAIPEIVVSWEEVGSFCRISITDNGLGFEQEENHRVFDFMHRLKADKSINGTGVGLSSCKSIVEKHGGQIGADSQPGHGSTFYFTLPLSR